MNAANASRTRSTSGQVAITRRRRLGMPAVAVVDTLASARRSGVVLTDTRPGAVAHAVGVPAASPVASVERAAHAETAREATLLVLSCTSISGGTGPS